MRNNYSTFIISVLLALLLILISMVRYFNIEHLFKNNISISDDYFRYLNIIVLTGEKNEDD